MDYEQEQKIAKAKMKKEITDLLKKKGWSRSDLANALKVDTSTVWRWLDDGKMPIPALQDAIRRLIDDQNSPAKQIA